MDINKYIKKIPDFPNKGIFFYDLSPLLASPEAWQHAVDKLCILVSEMNPTLLAGIESRGFLISSAIATRLKLGSVLVRKKGKTPGEVLTYSYDLEYGKDTLEISKGLVKEGSRIVLLDDVLATGGTLNASKHLFSYTKSEVVGAVCVMEIKALCGRANTQMNVNTLISL